MGIRPVSVFEEGRRRCPPPSQRWSIAVGRWLIALMAPTVVATHLAQLGGSSFRSYALLVCAWTLCVLGWIALRVWRGGRSARIDLRGPDRAALGVLLLTSAASSGLTLLCKVSSRDDYYYAPNPVHLLAHPGEAMGYSVHGLVSNTAELFTSLHWSTAIAFEYAQAAWAFGIGAHFLTVYHTLTPVILAALVPWALYALFCVWRPAGTSTALAVAATVFLLLCMGDTLRAPGNYSLLRLYQGKTVGFALGIPLFVTFACRFLAEREGPAWRSRDGWCVLGLTTWMAGTTTASIVIYPPLAAALVIAHLFSAGGWRRLAEGRFWRRAPGLLAAHGYLVVYGLLLWAFSSGEASLESAANERWPRDLAGHARFFWNPQQPVTPVVLAAATAASLWVGSASTRRFLVAWWAVILLAFLNPWLAPLWIERVTTSNIYWRWFYLLPLLPSLGLAWSALFQRASRAARRWRWALGGGVFGLLALALLFSPSSALRRVERVGILGYRIPSSLEDTAKQIIRATPPGPMLAPKRLSGVIPMLSADRPQMRLRDDGVRFWLEERGAAEDAERRIRASDFVGGAGSGEDALRALVEQYPDLRTLVLHGSVELGGETRALLLGLGFSREQTAGSHRLLWKPERALLP
jgi:hypothetical protein